MAPKSSRSSRSPSRTLISAQPLDPLLGPLRYACAKDFARLSTVKNLRDALEGALRRATGADPAAVTHIRAQLGWVDSPELQVRKNALLHVVQVLRKAGVAIDFVAEDARPRPALALTEPVPVGNLAPAAPNTPTSVEGRVPRLRSPSAGDEGSPVRQAQGERAAPKKKKVKKEADDPARMLSIAPAQGPLSIALKNVGFRLSPRLVGLLNKKGVLKVGDVLFLLPRVYEDRRRLLKIAQLRSGERGTIVAEVKRAEEVYGRSGRRTFRAVLGDSTGTIAATYFQSGPWLKAKFPIGKKLVVSGEVRQTQHGWEIPHPETEPGDEIENDPIHFNRIVPVYPGFERHEQRALRDLAFKISQQYADTLEEPLPESLRTRLSLLPLGEALRTIHFPSEKEVIEDLDAHRSPAHQRLAFDELFFLQLGLALRRQGVKVETGIAFQIDDAAMEKAKRLLPFALTGAQERVIGQLTRDMARPEPMNRLVQGDVGSGKTAVALVCAALAISNGYQVAVMAPTEILAEQHFKTFSRLLGVEVVFLSGGGTTKQRREQRDAVANGKAMVAVGTHALIQESVDFKRLGLVVIDEQHRFGVIQRHALMAKGVRPDVMVMTATPIPRTLAMTLYGDLDVSVIDELPPGRTPIVTRVFSEKARPKVWDAVKAELDQGHQAYVVYPLVEESEKVDLADATRGAAQLAEIFAGRRIGLLHGRMKNDEKEAVMTAFRAHQIDVLVATTVVEVGVDVPNASVMVIEGAERFGLSQLHQLRGRVGRGAAKSWCFLIAGYARSEEGTERLKTMEQSNDGFVIAEKDLEIRGPGEFLGTRQSGLPELAVANLARDQGLLAEAQDEARAIVAADPRLEKPEHARLVRALEERWEGKLKLARVG